MEVLMTDGNEEPARWRTYCIVVVTCTWRHCDVTTDSGTCGALRAVNNFLSSWITRRSYHPQATALPAPPALSAHAAADADDDDVDSTIRDVANAWAPFLHSWRQQRRPVLRATGYGGLNSRNYRTRTSGGVFCDWVIYTYIFISASNGSNTHTFQKINKYS